MTDVQVGYSPLRLFRQHDRIGADGVGGPLPRRCLVSFAARDRGHAEMSGDNDWFTALSRSWRRPIFSGSRRRRISE